MFRLALAPLTARVLLLAGIAEALWVSGGNYDAPHIVATACLYVAALFVMRAPLRWQAETNAALSWGLVSVVSLSLVLLAIDPSTSGTGSTRAHALVRALAVVAVAAWGGMVLRCRARTPDRAGWALFGVAMVGLFVARALVPSVCPEPLIDVFTTDTQAVDHFLHGNNPYSAAYDDIYGGRYGSTPVFAYLPVTLLWMVPARWGLGDVRFAFVLADALTALAIAYAARLRGHSLWHAALFASVWIASPVSLYIIQKSWVDGLLALLSAVGFVLLARRRFIAAGAVLGLAMGAKQYGALVLFLSTVWVVTRFERRQAVRFVSAAMLMAAASILPFAISSPAGFFESTVAFHVRTPLRSDSFSLPAFMIRTLHFGETGIVRFATSVLPPTSIALAAVCLVAIRRRGAHDAHDARSLMVALVGMFGTSFLFAKQAFCNYYQLLSLFVLFELMYAAGISPRPHRLRRSTSPRRTRGPRLVSFPSCGWATTRSGCGTGASS